MRLRLFTTILCLIFIQSFAQLNNGSVAPLFSATNTNGITFQLENELENGRFVVLHFFACWDYSSWEYANTGALNALDSIYGVTGTNELSILQIEVDSSNTTAQLNGPELLSGNNSTQTYGNWNTILHTAVSESFPVAQLFEISFVPAIVVICPDRRIRNFSPMPAQQLYESIREFSCPMPSAFADPDIHLISVNRNCGSEVVEVSWALENQGLDTLFEADFSTLGLADTFSLQWSGVLAPFESDTITTNTWELANALPFSVFLNTADSLADGQDSLTINSGLGISTMTVQLELALDNYPQEISWEILNDQDSVIFSGGDFNLPYEYINSTFEMPQPGCYTFKLFDTSGDGLHGSQWSGYDGSCYLRSIDTLTGLANAVLLEYDGSYNFSSIPNTAASITAFFEAGSTLEIAESVTQFDFNIFPNPTTQHSALLIASREPSLFDCTLYNCNGKKITHHPNNRDRCQLDCSGLNAGVYVLLIQADQQVFTHRIILQ